MASQIEDNSAMAHNLEERMSAVHDRLKRLTDKMYDNMDTMEDVIVVLEGAPQHESSVMSVGDISTVGCVYPEGFPLKTLEAFMSFSNEADPQRYEELVQWLAQCDGANLTAVINTMMKDTIKGDLPNYLGWTSNVKDSRYVKACRAAVNLMILQGKFNKQTPIIAGDGNFGAAVKAGLRSAKARWKRQTEKNK